ncbi:MAG TPA: hypothetical protein VMA53_17105, partial [Stellaceae bacterium]|nr:hypothetical protein [Stellaceae bacterium]
MLASINEFTSHHGGSDGPHGIEIESQADRTQEGEATGEEGEEDGETARRSSARQRQEGEKSRQAQSSKEGRAAQEGCPQESREEGGAEDGSAASGDADGDTGADAARAEAGRPAAAQAGDVGTAAPPHPAASAQAASAALAHAYTVDDAWQRTHAAQAGREPVHADAPETAQLGRLRLRRLLELLARGDLASRGRPRRWQRLRQQPREPHPSDKPPPSPTAAAFVLPGGA